MCAPTRFTVLDHHHIPHHRHLYFSLLRPACFSMAFKVPGGISRLGLPATVTVPGLVPCLYWRGVPRGRAHPPTSPPKNPLSPPTFTPLPWPFPGRVTFCMSPPPPAPRPPTHVKTTRHCPA